MIKSPPKTAVLQEFGQRVRSEREARGWSQARLAEEIGVNRTYIGSIERGEKSATLFNINRLALALGERAVGFLPCRSRSRRR